MHFFSLARSRRQTRSRAVAVAAALGLVCGVGSAGSLSAQNEAPRVPERVGNDAPHQERNPTNRPEAYLIRPHPAPAAVVDTGAVKVKVAGDVRPNVVSKKKRARGARAAAATVKTTTTAPRLVPVRKAEPVASPEELAAEREARRAELSRPTPIGSNGPHYERNGDPDVSAGRILVIERP